MQKINRQTIKLKIKLKMKTANIRHQTANIPLFASYVMWRVRFLDWISLGYFMVR